MFDFRIFDVKVDKTMRDTYNYDNIWTFVRDNWNVYVEVPSGKNNIINYGSWKLINDGTPQFKPVNTYK